MFSVAQVAQPRKNNLLQTWGLVGLLLLAVSGFLFFSMLHTAHAESFPTACDGDETKSAQVVAPQCDGDDKEKSQ